jgi:hypothetical protein
VVVANNFVGPVEGQATLEGVACSWILSFIRSWKFGGNGEYNVIGRFGGGLALAIHVMTKYGIGRFGGGLVPAIVRVGNGLVP